MRGRLTAGVLAASLIMAGCAGESPVSPLPTEAAVGAAPVGSVSVTPSPSPPRPSPASASPPSRRSPVGTPPSSRTPTRPSSPSSSSSCEGAVVRTIDATAEELALVPAMCLAVGAVLRVENIGPGEVTTDSPDLVAQHYEAGVVEVRFVRKGTVVVAIPQGGTTYDITVVVR
ncbi:hypothetical protein [Actinoplanes regularis]|uniref:hypothetical protein n=1 Tax=Actinoplanes regularis TaxID=52697 RepID=UPI0024A55BF2|nr:hypothetical protein [Actinoplanes regularis]GLW28291.1 hypothetical protein Areg01_12310 [Actinoplanes regularis]